MAGIDNIETFEMADENGIEKGVEVVIGRIHQRVDRSLDNFFGEYSISLDMLSAGGKLAVGVIKDTVLDAAVKKVRVNGEAVKFRQGQVWQSLPDLRDDNSGEGLGERLVRLVVKHNQYLGRHQTYSMVFSRYLPDESEEQDPTTDSSSSTPTSGTSLTAVEGQVQQ